MVIIRPTKTRRSLLQELGGARGLCVHPVIIVRLAPQISGLAEEGHAPLVRALKEQGPPHVLRHVRLPSRPALIPGGRPPPRLIHHLSTKLFRPPVAHNTDHKICYIYIFVNRNDTYT